MEAGGRIYAMTSDGSSKAIPQYGPVCAAKAILEAHIRQLALELAPMEHHRQRYSGGRDEIRRRCARFRQ